METGCEICKSSLFSFDDNNSKRHSCGSFVLGLERSEHLVANQVARITLPLGGSCIHSEYFLDSIRGEAYFLVSRSCQAFPKHDMIHRVENENSEYGTFPCSPDLLQASPFQHRALAISLFLPLQGEEKSDSLWQFIDFWHLHNRRKDESCWKQIADAAGKFLSPAMTKASKSA